MDVQSSSIAPLASLPENAPSPTDPGTTEDFAIYLRNYSRRIDDSRLSEGVNIGAARYSLLFDPADDSLVVCDEPALETDRRAFREKIQGCPVDERLVMLIAEADGMGVREGLAFVQLWAIF